MEQTQVHIPLEVIAAIAAALAAYLDQPMDNFVIRSVTPEIAPVAAAPSLWAKSGLLEAHFARRQFGIRTR